MVTIDEAYQWTDRCELTRGEIGRELRRRALAISPWTAEKDEELVDFVEEAELQLNCLEDVAEAEEIVEIVGRKGGW